MTKQLTVKLRNGQLENLAMVQAVFRKLRRLMSHDSVAFWDLICLARRPDHQLSRRSHSLLDTLAFLNAGGGLDDSFCNVILSAAVGEGLDTALQSPIHPAEPPEIANLFLDAIAPATPPLSQSWERGRG